MKRDTKYNVNPYTAFFETDTAFIINSLDENRIVLPKTKRTYIDFLLNNKLVSYSDLKTIMEDEEIEELIQKRVLLKDEVPLTEGRYSRQEGFFSLLTDNINKYKDQIKNSQVLILGAGAIGTHVLWNLAAMGVKNITVVDYDIIEESNLNRQLFYDSNDIGKYKVDVLKQKVNLYNPEVNLTVYNEKISSPKDLEKFIQGKTLVIKAIDSPDQVTEWINKICVKFKVPFIAGGFLDYEGIVGPIYIPNESYCAACTGLNNVKRLNRLFPSFAPLTTITAAKLSMIAFKIITSDSINEIKNKVYVYNTKKANWRTISLKPTEKCSVCGNEPQINEKNLQTVFYRFLVFLLAITVSLLNIFFRWNFMGIIALSILIGSLFYLRYLLKDNNAKIQKEIFNISCIYSITIIFINSIANIINKGFHLSNINDVFNIIQNIAVSFIQMGITISILFFILHICMSGIIKMSGSR
ncbi:ThiF family adenylyltransferase [Geobacillus sp. C56-T3]|uniref:HesA/MoeB/ThiF family protein n=1 Tax=Geobacillus sp. (strain C56-T3) TaxID=691437 RepID=UPI0001D58208|nr:ThiF family adenylyltransferase [Geobacillus sp. C56-T3]ADI25420.1 UBA/THIF-type NAD/FAD binding protein [Geobacillus sp. C56-T3]